MSLILEALSRSAKEHQTDSKNPGLDTPAYVEEPERSRAWRSALPWVVLLLALLAIAWLLVDKYTAEQTHTPVVVTPVENQAVSSVRSSAARELTPPTLVDNTDSTVSQSTTSKLKEIGIAKPVKSAPADPVLSDPAVEALYAERAPSREGHSNPTLQPAAKRADTENQDETPVQRSESVIDIEEVLTKTEEALKTSRLQEHSAPFITDVSQQFKDDIPSIMYRHHDYSTKPGESSVILNGKTLRVGGTVSGGVKVEEILPDSIVLNFRGQQFRLRALNSWVNF